MRVHKSTIVFGHDTMPQPSNCAAPWVRQNDQKEEIYLTAAKRRGPVRRFFGALGRAFAIMVFIGIITGSIVVSVMALYVFNALEDAPIVDLSNVEVNLNNTSYIYVTDPDTQEQTVVKELYSDRTASGSATARSRRRSSTSPSRRGQALQGAPRCGLAANHPLHAGLFRRLLPYPGRFHHHPSRSSKT